MGDDQDQNNGQGQDSENQGVKDYIISRIGAELSIKNLNFTDFKAKFEKDEKNKNNLEEFVNDKDAEQQLIIVTQEGPDKVQLSMGELPSISKLAKKSLVIIKLSKLQLTESNMRKDLAFLELTKEILQHLYCVFNEIMSPVMQNPENQVGWTDLVTKDLMEKFNNYIAQVYVLMGLIQGKTMLPLPSHKLTNSDTTPDKDKAHIFEGSIITWTKQIKNVLKLEPEMALKSGNDPGPKEELKFWKNKASNLNSIKRQLQSPEVKNILRFLEGNKSTYTNTFSKLQKEVINARIEANHNHKFLDTLEKQFDILQDENSSEDFVNLTRIFAPIMHTILLIWNNSNYYNTPPRLVVLIRQICNAIISQAMVYIDGGDILRYITEKQAQVACQKLQDTIDVCTKFKDAYFIYKAKANGEWKLTTNALFVRLDSFLERCHDIQHLTKTIVQFNKLEKIELGGTKGKTLTENIQQIYKEFMNTVNNFTSIKYNIIDIKIKEFDKNFYEFRNKIKELERRLASVITQGFDDYDTIYGRFKLLENFEDLLNRPIIQDELEKKHIVLLEMYKQDLKAVQYIFLEGKTHVEKQDEQSPLYLNMPPIAGTLTWCKSLKDRISEPMDKLSFLGQGIKDREEYKDVDKLHQSITKSIIEFENTQILSWEKEVEEHSEEKLKKTLLQKDEAGLIKVNFDPSLVRLLREVKYFQQLGLQVKEQAQAIFEKNDKYRMYIIKLDIIVANYNYIKTCLHPVEEPLVKKRIEEMEEKLEPGVSEYKWKDSQIEKFIDDSQIIVQDLYDIVERMKTAIDNIKQALSVFDIAFLERKTRSCTPDEYNTYQSGYSQQRFNLIKEQGQKINKQLKDIQDAVKIDKKSIPWKNYNDYINCIILDGINKAVSTALNHLNDQISPDFIAKNNIGCLFDIKLIIGKGKIQYDPLIVEETGKESSATVRGAINTWIRDFLNISVNRLDITAPASGDFMQEIKNNFEVKECMMKITYNLDNIELECHKYKEQYMIYKQYWEEDPDENFKNFLETHSIQDKQNEDEEEEEQQEEKKPNPLLIGCVEHIPDMEEFDKRIAEFKQVKQEIQQIDPSFQDIKWLKIDLNTLKKDLIGKVDKWFSIYTNFLKNQYKMTLENMNNFIKTTNKGLSKNPADYPNDKVLLMDVMKTNSEFKEVENQNAAQVTQRMKQMVEKLKKHNVVVTEKGGEDPYQSIENSATQFSDVSTKVMEMKNIIMPLQAEEKAQLSVRIEDFGNKVEKFVVEAKENLPYQFEDKGIEEIEEAYKVLNLYHQKLVALEQEAQDFNRLEKLFEKHISQYKQLKKVKENLKTLKKLWDCISLVHYQYLDWKDIAWRNIKAADFHTTNSSIKEYFAKKLGRDVRNCSGYTRLMKKIQNMFIVLPLVDSLHSEFMVERHWQQLAKITQKSFDQKQYTFDDVMDLNLYKFEAQILDLVEIAQKEAKIEKNLNTISQDWNKMQFEFETLPNIKLLKNVDVLVEKLDENALNLMAMKSQGKYVEQFIGKVEEWRKNLGLVDSVISEWLKVQKQWKVLSNIFIGSADIQAQLPEDTKNFEQVDKDFKELMNEASTTLNVLDLCKDGRLETLTEWNKVIYQCEKKLTDYLEQKKKGFPRFYFLSNQTLQIILSNGQNPPKVTSFLGDCFDGLKNVIFTDTQNEIPRTCDKMVSKDGEIVLFSQSLNCVGQVEDWLKVLEERMRESLQNIVEPAKQGADQWDSNQEKQREEWVMDYNAQISLLITQIVWTEDVGRAFEEISGGSDSAMKDTLDQIKDRLKKMIHKVTGDLHILDRWKIINIITIDVHGRDVVDKFNIQKIQEAESFSWLSQLKFYWENKSDQEMMARQKIRFPWERKKGVNKCIIRIVDWFRYYSYEYVGNSIRLVVTPLTDRCYITLTQALNLTMGGAPAGPAGTGKTETTKDLGRAIGIFVVVFNCSDQMNKASMAQIFMGLSQSGSWGCFDEFNRILIEVLSVVSSQVKQVLDALKVNQLNKAEINSNPNKQEKFTFQDEGELLLEDTVGFFITMNPGYAGRTELPENLKALFRSCAMVVPDLVLICENMLMSEGFVDAYPLSRKFVSLYMLSRELLSKQKHYDWGLRAVKSVLRQAGGLKRANKEMPENALLKRALLEFNIPKIVTDDQDIFRALISDLFPKVEITTVDNPEFKQQIKRATEQKLGLQGDDSNAFILKVVQLHEILEVRHCVFIIGPPGSGKTEVWKTLRTVYCSTNRECEYDTLNPKAVTSDQLFGAYNKSQEWMNGVLSMIMTNQVKNQGIYKESNVFKWSILDGDIDPEWIESLNTVMDDNKVLTLVSNDRIALTGEMRLLFEISNLKQATPATVSRAGVLYINETDIGWSPFVTSWIERSKYKVMSEKEKQTRQINVPDINEIAKSMIYKCFTGYFEQHTFDIFNDKNKYHFIVPQVPIAMVQSICNILDYLLQENEKKLAELKDDELRRQAYEAFFAFAGIWSIGGGIGGGQDDEEDMKRFSMAWRTICKGVKFPETGLVYDFFYSVEDSKWMSWKDICEPYEDHPCNTPIFSKIYVNTVHTTRLRYLCDLHVNRKKALILVGSAGTGKSAVITDYLEQIDQNKAAFKKVNFSSFTDAQSLQHSIESMVQKKFGKTFGSAAGKTLICYIDDLNMPFVDKYGTQSPIQLLRQIIDYESVFNQEQLEERKILQDLLFFACLNQKSGSFIVDLRLQRNFTVLTMYTPTLDIIKTIFGQIVKNHLGTVDPKLQKFSENIIEGTIYVFQKILRDTKFSPTTMKFHYQFNFRELSKIIEGVCRSTSNSCQSYNTLQKLWVHECKRTFEDRFVDKEDIEVFRKYLTEGLMKLESIDEANNPMQEPQIFSTFLANGEDGMYCCNPMNEITDYLNLQLDEYNEGGKAQMNLVLFQDAAMHVSKIARILQSPGGNALLVGVGGSGKQSLCRLSAHIVELEVDQLVVTGNFSVFDLKQKLQEIYKRIVKPSVPPRVFMLTDVQIKDEKFLIYINDMLNSGWIQDLFPKEDVDGFISNLKGEAKKEGIVDTGDNLSKFFYDKMKRQMKIVLCFSPVGDTMRVRSRKFPGIINSTSIDWFHPWPFDALVDVATRFLQDFTFIDDELRKGIATNMAEVHMSINEANVSYRKIERRFNYTTPKSFLELISFYKQLLTSKRETIDADIKKYQDGINIIMSTSEKVQGLQEELNVTQVKVSEKKKNTEQLIEKVKKDSYIVDQETNIANEKAQVANDSAQVAEKLMEEAEVALSEAIPAMREAEEAVNCLKVKNIQIMKAFANPPEGCLTIGKATLILLGENIGINDDKKKVWAKCVQKMNNPQNFIDQCKNFDNKNIPDPVLDKINKFIQDPVYKFTKEQMKSAAEAASFLCSFIINTIEYNRIYKIVKPLDEKKNDAVADKEAKMAELAKVQKVVKDLNDKLASLNSDLEEAENQKRIVEEEAAKCMQRLDAAENLVNGLSGENKRWSDLVRYLGKNIQSCIGDSLLAASFVSYIAPFSARLRRQLWQTKWLPDIIAKKIPITDEIEPLKILTNENEKAKWKNDNLPADPMSFENAAVITKCSRWPLVIDPQSQGLIWIKEKETTSKNGVQIINSNSKNWLNLVRSCVEMGKVVILEGIKEEIDATLDPLLQRSYSKKGNLYQIEVGGEEIEYNMAFKLYLITKHSNPHFRPEIAAQCTIINFIVTDQGLEEQLLAYVVTIEKDQLEKDKSDLVFRQNQYQVELGKLEAKLLESLGQAEPETILDNKALIEDLDKTKKTSNEIQEQTKKAKIQEAEINKQRENYRSVAKEGSILYFLIINLCYMDHMYQYSLESFQKFFFAAMHNTENKEEDTRIQSLIENIRFTIYQWVSRGLLEKHKIIFLTLITFRLMQKNIIDVQFEMSEMDFLIKCPERAGVENTLDWLPNQAWNSVQAVIQLEEFKLLAQNMEKDAPSRFQVWYNELTPEDVKLPLDFKRFEQQPFRKLLVLRCLRPDRLTIAIVNFIKMVLPNGKDFIEMDSKLSFSDILKTVINVDADHNTPIFFILSPGSDPVKEVEAQAKLKGMEKNKTWFEMALGEGMDAIARRRIDDGSKEGHWIMLQNIHLMPSWLKDLEKLLDAQAQETTINTNFRLFLSAEPSVGVPIAILNRSIKLTNEPPTGIKANMKRAWNFFPRKDIDDKEQKIKSILFALCFFHSTLIERKRFGPKGWNMMYPFNMGDLYDSYLVMTRYMEQNNTGKVPFADLKYIFGEIMYGGHIVDDWDRRLCNGYLDNSMHEELFDELELFPYIEGKGVSFKVPGQIPNDKYIEHIENSLQIETPLAYGLHPNAEIGFRTTQCSYLFNSLFELQPQDSAGDDTKGEVRSNDSYTNDLIKDLLEDQGLKSRIYNIEADVKSKLEGELKPFQNVFLQELQYMNVLLIEMVRSLEETDQALKGILTYSSAMEVFSESIALNKVPATWSVLAYPSKRGLSSWLVNLKQRLEQLDIFRDDPYQMSKVTMVSRFFNPQSFLTAIMQDVAQNRQLELNRLYIATDITKKSIEEIDMASKDGSYVFGFILEGARWDIQSSMLDESKPKEMFSVLPVVHCKPTLLPSEVKVDNNYYQCPVYKTEDRGNTYVFTAQLKTRINPRKWVLAGVAVLMDVEGTSDDVKKVEKK